MPVSTLLSQGGIVAVCIVVFVLFQVTVRRVSRWLFIPGIIALLGHIVVGLFVIPSVPYGWDVWKFHNVALAILEGTVPSLDASVVSFGTFQALVYSAFAADPRILSIVNGLLAVLAVLPIRELALRLYPSLRSAKGVSLVVLFLPLPFFELTLPMRDSLTVLVFFTILSLIARSYDTHRRRWILVTIPLFGVLDLLRPELAFVLLVGVSAATVVHVITCLTDRPVRIRTLIAIATPPILLVLPLVGPHLPIDRAEGRMLERTRGGAAYLQGTTYENWIDFVLAAPVRAVYFQFSPFPLHVSQPYHLVSALMLPILIVLIIAAYRSATRSNRDVVLLTLFVSIYVVGTVGYGLVDANFGTTARHRIPFSFLLCLLAAPVFERWQDAMASRLGLPGPTRVSQ